MIFLPLQRDSGIYLDWQHTQKTTVQQVVLVSGTTNRNWYFKGVVKSEIWNKFIVNDYCINLPHFWTEFPVLLMSPW